MEFVEATRLLGHPLRTGQPVGFCTEKQYFLEVQREQPIIAAELRSLDRLTVSQNSLAVHNETINRIRRWET